MLASLTALGLSAAAGLNAYIPLLLVGLLARFTGVVTLPDSAAWIAETWALVLVGILLAVEVVVDKIALVDSVNDAIQTFVRPAVGGAVFAATAAAQQVDASPFLAERPWLGWLLGIAVAGVVHALKTASRPLVDVGTAGVGTPVVSAAEDAASVGLSLVAVFAPVLVIVALAALAAVAVLVVRGLLRRRRRSRRSRLA
jgi:hypothetical protein